jgi:hypothetical protein
MFNGDAFFAAVLDQQNSVLRPITTTNFHAVLAIYQGIT